MLLRARVLRSALLVPGTVSTVEPKYAVKFMARVDENRAEEAVDALRGSVAPGLRKAGFCEVLVVSRRLLAVESRVLRRLLEGAPAESRYAGQIRALHETLVTGGPTGYAHAMVHHRLRTKYPEEHRLIREALDGEDNWVEIPTRRFDCYALYATELDMKADTLGRRDLAEGRPHSGDLVARELGGFLVSPLRGALHTVLHRSSGSRETVSGEYAAQTQVSAFLHRKEARAWIRERLLPALTPQRGYLDALVLRSRNMGFVAGRGATLRGFDEHRGEARQRSGQSRGTPAVLCECVTLWETPIELEAGVDQIVRSLPVASGGDAGSAPAHGTTHTERGKRVLQA